MGRLNRFRDRAASSYKTSEVLGLFVLSIFFGMLVYFIGWALCFLLDRVTG